MLDASPNSWALHDICGTDYSCSMVALREVDQSLLRPFDDIEYNHTGWPAGLSTKDRALGKQYNFDPDLCVEDDLGEEFVKFSTLDSLSKIKSFAVELFPALKGRDLDCGAFSTFFAHLHDDVENLTCRGQLNIILDNPAGHRLLSVDQTGQHHVCTPKRGEIVFLDIHCAHAIMPNQEAGPKFMSRNPMKSLFVSLLS